MEQKLQGPLAGAPSHLLWLPVFQSPPLHPRSPTPRSRPRPLLPVPPSPPPCLPGPPKSPPQALAADGSASPARPGSLVGRAAAEGGFGLRGGTHSSLLSTVHPESWLRRPRRRGGGALMENGSPLGGWKRRIQKLYGEKVTRVKKIRCVWGGGGARTP